MIALTLMNRAGHYRLIALNLFVIIDFFTDLVALVKADFVQLFQPTHETIRDCFMGLVVIVSIWQLALLEVTP